MSEERNSRNNRFRSEAGTHSSSSGSFDERGNRGRRFDETDNRGRNMEEAGGHSRDEEEEYEREAAYRRRRQRRQQEQNINRGLVIAVAVLVIIVLILLIATLIKGSKSSEPTTTEAQQVTTQAADTESVEATEEDTETKAEEQSSDSVPADTEPPVISGVTAKTITVGDTVAYLDGVTVTDNVDTDIEIQVNRDGVDLNTPGEYKVVYYAEDAAGNYMEVETTITVLAKETQGDATDQEISDLNSYSRQILKRILTDEMTDMEKLGRIYDWVRFECDYVDDSDKSSWVRAALSMIDTRKGDCFSYYAVAKALVENAGFETVDVVKSNTEHSRHYWSLVKIDDGWYHYDTTPRHGDGDYFCMITDAQLEAYSKEHEDSHNWDKSLYPTVSEKVITDMGAEDGNVPVYKLNY